MASILESAMLVCFGFSWPLNMIKAYKAKTAKGTSFAFILLIITGYVAGIFAKILNGQTNYVLIVYLLNLLIVLTNLGIYFRNKSLDRRKETMKNVERSVKNNNVVLFGGSLDKMIPVAEIAQDYDLNFKMYNKSFSNLCVKNAKKTFIEQVSNMNPESVIIHLGCQDLDLFSKNSVDFDVAYLDLISYLKAQNKDRRIALVSNYDAKNQALYEQMNRHIKAISESENCTFLNLNDAKLWNPETTKELMSFMYNVGFDKPLNIKKPLLDICEIIYSYAYQNGILDYSERAAV